MPEGNDNAGRPRDPIDDAMDGLMQVQQIAAYSRAMLHKVVGKFEAPVQSSPAASAEVARQFLRLRRRRETLFDSIGFGKDMLGEPVWDMLLDLYVAMSQGKRISVSSLCLAASVPSTTALRYIRLMEQRGLVTRHGDPDDARRVFIQLSDKAVELMDAILS